MFTIIYFLVLGWFTYKVYIWPTFISPLKKIPGPPSENFFFGHIRELFKEEAGEPEIRWTKEHGSVLKYHGLFNTPYVLITDTKIVQEILVNKVYDFQKPDLMNFLKKFLGNGIAFAEGETHKRQRKMISPAFSHNNIKEMVPTFVRVALILKGLLEAKVANKASEINLSPYISKATLDIIGLVGFDYEFNSLTSKNELAEAYNAVWNLNSTTLGTIITVLSRHLPFIRSIPIPVNNRFNNGVKVIERMSKNLVEGKISEAKTNKLEGNDLLSILINSNQSLPIEEQLTDEELKYQVMSFLAAGHETTASAICWALYFLSQHPTEQDLLREEIVKAFPDKLNFNPTFDEINSLEYLNCVFKEILRLVPPAVKSLRTNIEDKVLGEYFIPKGTPLVISIIALHRSPLIWGSTAENFDPKRWLDHDSIKNITNYNYLPFLTGPRSCLGNKLATAEFKIFLSMLIRNFVFQPIEGFDIKRKNDLVNRPHPCLKLNVSKVEA